MGTWSVSPNDGVIGSGPSFTFPENTASNRKKYTVTYSGDSKEVCSKDIYVAGTGSPVDCCSQYWIPYDNYYIIPSSGVTNGHELVAALATDDADNCPLSNLTVTSSTISGLVVEESTDERLGQYDYGVFITNCDPVGQSTVKAHTVTLVSDGVTCPFIKSFEVIQEGEEEKCSCESVDYWLSVLNGKVDNSSHNDLLIATGDTHGCGVISATTDSEMLDGRNVRCSYSDDNSIVEIYADVLANTSGVQRSSGIKIFFKKMTTGGTYDECADEDIILVQTDNIPSCDNISCSRYNDELAVPSTSGDVMYTFYIPSSGYSDYAVAYEFLEGGEYVDHVGYSFRSSHDILYVRVYYKENTSSSSRTIKIKLTPYIGVVWNGDTWSGGLPCEPQSCIKTITQEPGGGCECSQASLSIDGDNPKQITDMTEHDESIYLNFSCGGMTRLPNGWSITVKSFEPQTFITGVDPLRWSDYFNKYYSRVYFAANPQGETRSGTIVYCLHDDSGECKCISAMTKQEFELCDSCETFKNKFRYLVDTEDGSSHNNYHIPPLYEPEPCWHILQINYCDSSGNIISGYNWLSNLTAVTTSRGSVDIAENDTGVPRTAYFALEGLKSDGTPIFNDCKAIYTLTQTPLLECNCTNVTNGAYYTSTANTSSSNPVNTGVTNVYVGRVIYTIDGAVKIDCVEVVATSTQTDCVGNISVVTTTTSGVYKKIEAKIYCDTYDSQAIPVEGLQVTIDVHLKCGTEDCAAGATIITLYIKRQ